MPSIAPLILLVIGGTAVCVKARAAGPAALFAALSVLFVVSTPVASGLPGAVSTVMSVIDRAAAPVLSGDRTADVDEQGGDDEGGAGSGSHGVRQVEVDR